MIPVLGLCAALTIGCSVRAVVLVDQQRRVADLCTRLLPEEPGSALARLRARGAPVLVAIRSHLDRITGAGRRRVDRRTLVLLEAAIRRLRSGASLRTALHDASAESPGTSDRCLAEALDDGVSLREALEVWMVDATASRVLVGTSLQLAAETGGAVAVVLDGVAETLRERLHLDREVAALASQTRASAMVLVIAPVGFAVLMAGVDPRVARLQFGSPLGWVCCAVGITLDVLGALWMS
ncbi:MAG: hypothetical protein EBX39_05520, partial [Actinobacteria bacterium]|nr:hypothetical protein [Actinomycetota bacterium]